jgi:twitching motility two-component system response regulator PilG
MPGSVWKRRRVQADRGGNMAGFVMVIDDSLVIRKILEICLRRAGYAVKSFPDGVEALRWLNTSDARHPNLIVVDLGLPKLDGYQVIRLLKARPDLEHTTLVILSQHNGILDRLKGRLVGAHAYLTKPFQTDQVVAVIQASLEKALPHVEGARRPGSHEWISWEATTCSPTSASLSPPPGTASR